MIYNRTTWENSPSTSTPINAQNLNKIEQGITDAANEINAISHIVNVGTEVEEDSRVNFIHSRNLFDANTMIELTNQVRRYSDGAIVNVSNFYGIKVPVKPNTTYIISSNLTRDAISNLCYFDGNTYLSGDAFASGTLSFTTPNNCNYITLAIRIGYTWFQIEEGSTATPYKPFTTNEINIDNEKYTDTINVGTSIDSRSRVNVLHSNNLFENTAITTIINGITYTKNSDGTITANGTASANASIVLGKIKTDSSKSYYLSGCPSGGSQSTYTMYVSGSSPAINDFGSGVSISGTTFDNNLTFVIFSGQTVSNMVIKPMLIEGTSALPFEPYIVPSINVDGEEIYSKEDTDIEDITSKITCATGWSIDTGKVFKQGKHIYGTIQIKTPSSLPASTNSQNVVVLPYTLSGAYIMGGFTASGDKWSMTSGLAYVYIGSNGSFTLTNSNTATYFRVQIDVMEA